MSGLAEDDLAPRSAARRVLVPLAVLTVLVLVGWGSWWLKSQMGIEPRPQRQVARISVLPDLPPPPPPPKELPKPPPREEAAPKPEATPKEAVPETAPLKMEGAAGDGPSAFAAGTVTQELGATPPAGPPPVLSAADRMQERLYAQSTRQLLSAEIERHLRGEAVDLTATFAVWLRSDGSIDRFEILPGTDPDREPDLRSALDEAARSLRLPRPPSALPQPLRFRLTVRPLG